MNTSCNIPNLAYIEIVFQEIQNCEVPNLKVVGLELVDDEMEWSNVAIGSMEHCLAMIDKRFNIGLLPF